MTLLRSIATIGVLTLVSRVFGFVRDILIAAVLGAGTVTDVFFVAFKFPNLFRRLFAEGAFNMAFVPLFAGTLEEHGPAPARRFADQAFAALAWTLLIVVLGVEIVMPWIMALLVAGFADESGKMAMAVATSRITFPYVLFISLVALMAGVLNSLGRFAAAAAAPVILNLCLIAAILGLTPHVETGAHALAWGVAAAGLAQFGWLLAHCRRAGFAPRLRRPVLSDDVRLLVRRIVPAALGAGIYQVNLVVDMAIASFLPAGSFSFLNFADRVVQLPLGVVGVAVGTALLPLLSRQLRAGDLGGAHHNQNRALEFAFLLTVPAAAALAVLPDVVVAALFQRGRFDDASTAATAGALAAYALGLPAYVLVKVLAPGFFARGDTRTPVAVSVVALVSNVALNLILMGPFRHVGIAMATAATAWLNAGLLAWILHRRGHLVVDGRLARRLPRIVAATLVMAGLLWAGREALAPWAAGPEAVRAATLVLLVAGGLLTFAAAAHLSGAARLSELKGLLWRRT